jgi:hypothetical protein
MSKEEVWEGRLVRIVEEYLVVQTPDGRIFEAKTTYSIARVLKIGDTIRGKGDTLTHLNRIIK